MSKEPEALVLAEEFDRWTGDRRRGAAELRRLHALNVELVEALEFIENLYSYEASVGENASALYDAKTRARYALAKAAS